MPRLFSLTMYMWFTKLRGAPQLSIDIFLASLLSHMTEYIFIENDKFKSHFSKFQIFRSCMTAMMQERYQWKAEELLLIGKPHVHCQTK